MKSILYVGATLMIGASIYGFVDYKQTSRNAKFKTMYDQQEQANDVKEITLPVNKKEIQPLKEEKKVLVKEATQQKPVFERSKIEIVKAEKIESDPGEVETDNLKESKSLSTYKKVKKRKLNTKLFSRAPLREEIEIEETAAPKAVKTDDLKKL